MIDRMNELINVGIHAWIMIDRMNEIKYRECANRWR